MARVFLLQVVVFFSAVFVLNNSTCAQQLISTPLGLNVGGVINDAIYDPFHECYIVVGKFDSIAGVARKNIAFLHKNDLSVLTNSFLVPFENIDGEIRTVAITGTGFLPTFTYHLYIGGNFSTITKGGIDFTRKGIAKFTASHTVPSPPANFNLSTWNPDLDLVPLYTGYDSPGVNDILITNDTVIFCGNFFAVNTTTSPSPRDGVAAYKLNGLLLAYPSMASSGLFTNSSFLCLEKVYGNLYVGGTVPNSPYFGGALLKLNTTGAVISGFNYSLGGLNCVFEIKVLEDSLLTVLQGYNAFTDEPNLYRICRLSDGSFISNHSLTPQAGSVVGGVGGAWSSLAVYKNSLYTTTSQINYSAIGFESNSGTAPVSGTSWNANATNNLNTNIYGKIHVAGNRLFVSASNLNTLSGATKKRLGAYCLEPHDAKFFTTSDSTICPEEVKIYEIPAANFADGYKWEYTGLGCNIIGYGAPEEILPVEIELATAYSIQIEWLPNFTPGQLKVTPFTVCNGIVKLYSNTIVTNIVSNPLPHIDAGNDTSLTCAIDSISLFGFSNDPVISYEWLNTLPPHNVGQDTLVTQPGTYIFKVKDALGCPNFDTVFVDVNDTKPIALPPSGTYDLTCAQPVKDFLGSTPSPNTTMAWFDLVDSIYYANPISISAPGSYQFLVTDTLNGCTKDTSIFVVLNQTQADINIQNYATINTIPFENLTCTNDSILLVCFSATSNSSAEWTNNDATLFFGDTLIVTNPGNYYIQSINNSNGCTNSGAINISANQNLPNSNVPPTQLLNCSVDSIFLDGNSLVADAKLEWNGPSVVQASDPIIIYSSGVYYLTVTDTINGCSVTDSVIVNQDASINVFAGNDTLVCDQALINLIANYSGNITGINYLWNSGSTNSSELFTAGTSNFGTVEIFGDNGCYGSDTVYFNLPPVPVINFTGYKPCDDGASGSIVASPVSGMSPFLYSIDNGNSYQSSANFSGLTVGAYPIWVKDSLLCDYSYSATIDENSALPSPSFLFSTYNYASDTVVIIDISNPPTDSTNWVFPNGITILDNNLTSPIILLPDTGTFVITMQAYYGNCMVELNKTIYSAIFDSTAANQYNQNGIKSITLYPNPTSGDFIVEVEFFKSQRSAFVIQDMIGYTYENQEFDESLIISAPVSLNLSAENGTYVLKLVSEFDSASLTFILTR